MRSSLYLLRRHARASSSPRAPLVPSVSAGCREEAPPPPVSSSFSCSSSPPSSSFPCRFDPISSGNILPCSSGTEWRRRSFSTKIAEESTTPHQVISLPALSPTMAKGNIPSWSKKEGDKVNVGEVLCQIETDKSTMEMEAMEEGYLAKILLPAGSTDVAVGQPIAIIVENEEDIGKVNDILPSTSGSTEEKSSGQNDKKVAEHLEVLNPSTVRRQRLGPSVRKLLIESGIDVTTLKGTGPGGAVVKGDVLAAMKSGETSAQRITTKKREEGYQAVAATPQHPAGPSPLSIDMLYEDFPTTQIRKIIAKRLLESKNGIPHLYLSIDTLLDETLALRKDLKEKHGLHVSVNDIIIKAVASALKSVPEANAHWDEKTGSIIPGTSIDISIAVATEKGLITPILRDADKKSLAEISSEIKVLAAKAREGKLQPHEFQGGSFSISNLGMYTVDHFCAIINPPQACILAVGRGQPSVIWDEDLKDPDHGKPRAVTKMSLTLSADHRVVDADIGGRFLDVLAGIIKDSRKLLL